MAKLTESDRAQLRRSFQTEKRAPASARPLSPREYLEFATFAARFTRATKSVRFGGRHWRL